MSTISRTELQLARGRLLPLFLRYALPGVLAMVFLALQTIADGFIVGRLISADALASVNIAAPVYGIVTAVSMIIGVGTQAQVSINMGAGEYSKARTAYLSGLAGLAFFAVCGTLFVNLNAENLASSLGADADLLSDTVSYIHGVMPWLLGIAAHIFFDNMLKAIGHPRFAMLVTVSTIVLNIILSLIFVGILDMGTLGAGMGTGISFTLGGAASAILYFANSRKNTGFKEAPASFSIKALRHILYNGSSEGLSEVAYAVTTFLFNVTLMKYAGKEGVSAFTIINYLSYFGISIALGVSTGMIPVISYNHGAGSIKRVRKLVAMSIKTNLFCGLFFFLLFLLFGKAICGLFIEADNAEVLNYASRGAFLTAFAFLFNGFNILSSSYFTAIDKAGHSLLISSLRGLLLLSIFIVLLPKCLGYDGVMLAMPIAEAITFVIASAHLRKYLYR